MPDSEPPPLPPGPAVAAGQKGRSAVKMILIVAGSVIVAIGVIAVGVMSIGGVQRIVNFGGDKLRQQARALNDAKQIASAMVDPQWRQLLAESDAAVGEANKNVIAAQPVFEGFLNDVDKLGLATVRANELQAAETAGDLFGKASESFRRAGKTLEEAIQRKQEDKLNSFFAAKIKSYELYAQSADFNREIIRLVLDDSIPDVKTLLPKITELGKQRNEAQRNAAKISADATASVKKAK